jgi:histidyl-tRNA synthetase
MTDSKKTFKPKARVAKGFRDIDAAEIRGIRAMLATIQGVYESYGFEPVEQPFIEYTEALGKFLPDQDRPNAGVFSFQDDDEQWLSLRYDLTAPLARYVAENNQGQLPTPYRSYRQGWVFRNEKPGPGRFRQFMQFDADTVGSANPAADAEVCMMAADTMEALGLRGSYIIKVSNRKLLDGLLEEIGLQGAENYQRRMTVLRAVDKFDKFGRTGVEELLGSGRTDESGDRTEGARLDANSIKKIISFVVGYFGGEIEGIDFQDNRTKTLELLASLNIQNDTFLQGLNELAEMNRIFGEAEYSEKKITFSTAVVRGLEYYTGPIFECELLFPETQDGNTVRFGSVGGGGRYDDLVSRFTGTKVPATGFSIGVSRLYSALERSGKAKTSDTLAPVVVLVMDKAEQGTYWRMVQQLRGAGIRAEMYMGTAGIKAQMKYADKRGAPLVVIQGGDEKAAGQVQIKDLRLGSQLAAGIETREEYASQRLAQFMVPEADLVAAVKKALGQ